MRFDPERQNVLKAGAECWWGIATSGSTETLYERLTNYPPEIVSNDLGIAITRAMEGTPKAHDFHKQVVLTSQGLTMFKTSQGLIGTAPPGIGPGDWVAMIMGLRMPFILRPVEESFRILGPCYVHGVMGGEYWVELSTHLDTEFVLI